MEILCATLAAMILIGWPTIMLWLRERKLDKIKKKRK